MRSEAVGSFTFARKPSGHCRRGMGRLGNRVQHALRALSRRRIKKR
ncbi:helicase HerA-like domain-containing protein [Shigella flexneri]